jgi:cation diffusion facilitator family transporter
MLAPPPGTAADDGRAMRTAVVAGGIDLLVTLGALVAAQSAVILADFCKTLLEFIAVVIAWITLRSVRRGGYHRFDYGVGKLENLSSLLVGLLMCLCLGVIITNAILGLLHPVHISGVGVWVSLGAQAVYGIVNTFLTRQSRRHARLQNSPLHEAQAGLFLTKAVGNGFIFLSLGLSKLLAAFPWSVYIDPLSSVLIGASILLAALGIFKNSTLDLMDRTLEEKHQIAILRSLANYFDRYAELREIRSRRSGRQVFVEIVLGFGPQETAGQAESTARELKADVERAIPGSRVTIAIA